MDTSQDHNIGWCQSSVVATRFTCWMWIAQVISQEALRTLIVVTSDIDVMDFGDWETQLGRTPNSSQRFVEWSLDVRISNAYVPNPLNFMRHPVAHLPGSFARWCCVSESCLECALSLCGCNGLTHHNRELVDLIQRTHGNAPNYVQMVHYGIFSSTGKGIAFWPTCSAFAQCHEGERIDHRKCKCQKAQFQ